MKTVYSFERSGRSLNAVIAVLVIWAILILARLLIDAAWGIVGFLALFTLPVVIDLIRAPMARLYLTRDTLGWSSGRRAADLALSEIDHIRLDTRLDFSVRVTAILINGRKIRLPFECSPPSEPFEEALHQQDVKTQRHHFALMQ